MRSSNPLGGLSRRTLIRGGLGLAAAATLLGTAGCGAGSRSTLNWGNWTYYLDYDEETGRYPSLEEFTDATGTDVQYLEDIDSTDTFYGKIKDQLQLGHDTGYDTFCIGDTLLLRLLDAGVLQAFDHDRIPNLAQLLPHLRESSYDPGLEHSIPWQTGMTGLCYNTRLYPRGIASVADLTRADLAGRVGVLSVMSNTTGLIMLDQGVDIGSDWGRDAFEDAIGFLEKHLASGQIAQVKGNSYTQDLQTGDLLAGMCWSGDIAMLNAEAGEEVWRFVVPEAGASYFTDSFVVPTGSERRADVEALIDFYYRPEIAARVAAQLRYVTPVAGAREAMERIDPDLVEDPLIFPSDEMAARLHEFRPLTSTEDREFSAAFASALGL
ncbi:ABC transporter substrate-binding protein [Leucobacter sp.]